MGNERVDFSRLARDRIEAAQAAIAAAEESAMHAYAAGSFHDSDTPVAPWVASPGGQFHSSFAERLRKHEAHLNTIKNALPFHSDDSRVYNTSAPADSHRPGNNAAINHLQLPPWSQPAQLPSFSSYQKPDSLGSKVSLEGSSRVSTAGSGATIGWAGPWVVTHRAGGADRMYPAHMRSNKPTKRLQAHKTASHTASAHLEPHSERNVARQDILSNQAVPDVRWHIPPHNRTAAHAMMPSQAPPKRNASVAPSKHSPPQQSRIPSPTKSTSQKAAAHPEGPVNALPPNKQVPGASQPRHADHLQSVSMKQSVATLYPSEGPGSLRESIRDKNEWSQGDLQSRKHAVPSERRKHAGKDHKVPQRVLKPRKPAWIDADVGSLQGQLDGSGRHAPRQPGDSAVLCQRNQQHAQKNAAAFCKSEASEAHDMTAAAPQLSTRRLQAFQQLPSASAQNPSSQRNTTVHQRGKDKSMRTVNKQGSQGLSKKWEAATANDSANKTTVQTTIPCQEPANPQNSSERPGKGHDQYLGRSSTPIERLRRLQRTRTNTQSCLESMDSSPNSMPLISAASSINELPEPLHQLCSASKTHESNNGNTIKGKSSLHKAKDDSEHRIHAVRKLQAGNAALHGTTSATSTYEFSGSKVAPRELRVPRSTSNSTSTAQNRGPSNARTSPLPEVGLRGAYSVEDTPVGPGRTGAGIDFDKLIDLKLQEHGESPAAAVPTQLKKCGTCERQFTTEALAKHRAVCAKVFASKRQPMDMTQQRLSGIAETAQHRGTGYRSGTSSYMDQSHKRGVGGRPGALGNRRTMLDERAAAAEGLSRAGKWKQQSQQLRAAMNSNKRIQEAEKRGEDITSLQLQDSSMQDDRVPCPHCSRKFAALVAERHIPKCKDIRAKPSFLKKGSGNAGGNLARLKPSR